MRAARLSAGMVVAGLLAGLSAATPARAVDWTVTLGVEGRVLPSYEGSDRYVLRPVPLVDIRRAGTPRHFSSPNDGASIGVFETSNFRLGPTVKLKMPRREGDDADLRGLGNVGWVAEPGVFAEYWPQQWLRTRAEVRQGIGGHHGLVGDLSADVVMPVTQHLTLSAGPRLSLASATANDPYFSIDAAQSAASGLPVYDAKGGVSSYGLGALARYEWSTRWATHFFVEYEQLTGSVADSPIVALRGSRNQVQTGIGITYSFDVPGLW